MRICKICGMSFPETEEFFYRRETGKLRPECKDCLKHRNAQRYEINRNCILEKQREYGRKNSEAITERAIKWAKENPKQFLKNQQKYRATHKEQIGKRRREYIKERLNSDPVFQIKTALRKRLWGVLNKQGIKKSKGTMDLLGCSVDSFKAHIESQWTEGMSWENYSLYGWHIDHIKPCASFNLLDEDQQQKCFHYTNMQPLWATDNNAKRAKLEWSK